MTNTADLAIVGGGAAGLAAAIFAAQKAGAGRRIVLVDQARSLGAKILVSGGGRCNVTHDAVRPEDYNGVRPVVRHVLAAFSAADTVRWFAALGVLLKREATGKLFPASDSARTVLTALINRCRELGVTLQTGTRVKGIVPPDRKNPFFIIEHDSGATRAARLIMATGGRSLPKSGSDGSGWELVRPLGHTVTPTYPALTPLVLERTFFHAELSGISQEVELAVLAQGKRIDRRSGSLLWTHFGLSGPVVMDASRHWVIAQETGQKPELRCNLLTPDGFEKVERWFIDLASSHPKTTIAKALALRLPQRAAAAIVRHAGIAPALTCGQLTRDSRRTLVHALTALKLPVAEPCGWDLAEVTAGGVPLNEIDFATMESRKIPGLYLAGEMLDCDGRIGGFNFQWAWSTGFLAGLAAARHLPTSSS